MHMPISGGFVSCFRVTAGGLFASKEAAVVHNPNLVHFRYVHLSSNNLVHFSCTWNIKKLGVFPTGTPPSPVR